MDSRKGVDALNELQGVKVAGLMKVNEGAGSSITTDAVCRNVQCLETITANDAAEEQDVTKAITGRRRWLKRDRTFTETFANVATSLPFFAVGLSTPRTNKSAALYGKSIIGIGMASSAYHMSRGESRKFFRWGDYAMIATSTMCLSNALHKNHPMVFTLASAALLPFQPLLVIAAHTTLMETAFFRKATREPKLRPSHRLHAAATIAGGALYVADELCAHQPFLHAGWHLAAALGIHTANVLLK